MKNLVGMNEQRRRVLIAVDGMQVILDRIKSDLAEEVTEKSTSVSGVNLEWYLASHIALVKAINAHDVSVAYAVG